MSGLLSFYFWWIVVLIFGVFNCLLIRMLMILFGVRCMVVNDSVIVVYSMSVLVVSCVVIGECS